MKCLCGFEADSREWVELALHTEAGETEHAAAIDPVEVEVSTEGESRRSLRYLFACPKCSTVRMA